MDRNRNRTIRVQRVPLKSNGTYSRVDVRAFRAATGPGPGSNTNSGALSVTSHGAILFYSILFYSILVLYGIQVEVATTVTCAKVHEEPEIMIAIWIE